MFAIGADLDQDDLAPGKVLVSVLKRIDVAVFGAIKAAKDEDFKSGHHFLGIADGATGLTEMRIRGMQFRSGRSRWLRKPERAS